MHPVHFPKIVLTTPGGARAEIYQHGAHVASWIPANDTERMFLSAKSAFETGAAIRGGVPVVFPQFSQLGPLPKHGLVRTQPWEMLPAADNAATLRIRETEDTRRLWPHAFEAQLTVKLEDASLALGLAVMNTDDRPFTFTCALHTYLRVHDIAQTQIEGLHGRPYRDAVRGNQNFIEEEAVLRFAGETDRVYHGPAADVIVREPDRALTIRQAGFVDTVVWNPGAQLGATLPDLETDGYRRYVCVEAALADTSVTLEPQATWRGSQILMVTSPHAS
jgi:glucose-6-phosphate 1-epimerase